MKQVILILAFFASLNAISSDLYEVVPPYSFISKKENSNLAPGTSEVFFRITGIRELTLSRPLVWSIDEHVDTTQIGNDRELRSILEEGKHSFQFFYSRYYEEISTEELDFKAGYTYIYQLNFQAAQEFIQVEKPVIYVYPDVNTDITLNVIPTGEMRFTYPVLPTVGWKFTAHPDGKLLFGDQSFRYLFWESSQAKPSVNTHNGSLIAQKNVLAFLEEKLTLIGLTSEEKADFITYWAPQMMQNSNYFIQFQFNEDCNQYAELDISPKPDRVNRVYMVFKGMDVITDNLIFIPQKITPFDRNGYTVLEWGGMEL
jgi:hypothetical protein